MMIAAEVRRGQLALAVGRAAELAAPDHERVVEQAALLQIGDQRGAGLVDVVALQREIRRQVVVLIPAAMVELDETHAALGQPAREQAVRGEACRACAPRRRKRRTSPPARLLKSVSSGTEVCMRNAISYCAMRVSISGSSDSACCCAVQFAERRRASAAGRRRVDAVGIREIQHRIAAGCGS